MSKTSWRLILFVLAGSILGWVLIGPEPANASKTDSVKEVRISRLAKGINIPSWFWLNRDPVDDLEKRYPDTDFQLIKKLGFTNVRIPVDMANVYDKDQPDLLQKENLPYLDRGIKKILSYELARGEA